MAFLDSFLRRDGQDFEVRRGNETFKAIGLVNKGHIDFSAGTDIQENDFLVGIVSGNDYRVVAVENMMERNRVAGVKAFVETKAGLRKKAMSQPKTSTITVGTMVNSAIQQDSPGATQNLKITLTKENKPDLEGFLAAVLESLDKLGLAETEKTNLQTDAETVQAQLKRDPPNSTMISEGLKSIKGILEGAATATLASGAENVASGLLNQLLSFFGIGA